MKIAVLGPAGNIGRRIVREALDRGHQVTAIGRHAPKLAPEDAREDAKEDVKEDAKLASAVADVTSADQIAEAVRGHDAIVSAVGPAHDGSQPTFLVDAARALVEGAKRGGVKRLVTVGGAGSLFVSPGLQLVDTPTFPAAWKGVSSAHRDALAVFRKVADLDWTYVSPAALIEPGTRTGKFRIGGDDLLVDAEGQSQISMEDFAIAVVDELEQPRAIRRRITVAY